MECIRAFNGYSKCKPKIFVFLDHYFSFSWTILCILFLSAEYLCLSVCVFRSWSFFSTPTKKRKMNWKCLVLLLLQCNIKQKTTRISTVICMHTLYQFTANSNLEWIKRMSVVYSNMHKFISYFSARLFSLHNYISHKFSFNFNLQLTLFIFFFSWNFFSTSYVQFVYRGNFRFLFVYWITLAKFQYDKKIHVINCSLSMWIIRMNQTMCVCHHVASNPFRCGWIRPTNFMKWAIWMSNNMLLKKKKQRRKSCHFDLWCCRVEKYYPIRWEWNKLIIDNQEQSEKKIHFSYARLAVFPPCKFSVVHVTRCMSPEATVNITNKKENTHTHTIILWMSYADTLNKSFMQNDVICTYNHSNNRLDTFNAYCYIRFNKKKTKTRLWCWCLINRNKNIFRRIQASRIFSSFRYDNSSLFLFYFFLRLFFAINIWLFTLRFDG